MEYTEAKYENLIIELLKMTWITFNSVTLNSHKVYRT